uniref:ADAM metallopeptidase domain 8b n=1 Tax=Sinocyclocheilus grahami TaxID=75366 RepID=A0A672PVE4_SINGR
MMSGNSGCNLFFNSVPEHYNPNLLWCDNCYYHGHIQDLEDSSVSVGICSGIRGFVRVKQQVYLIEPLTNHSDGDHALYKHEHLRWKRSSCGEPSTTIYDHEQPKTKSFHTRRYVELFLVVDNTELINVLRKCKRVNTLFFAQLYRPLNIRVMLVGLEVWTKRDQIVVSVSSDDTLSRFIEWRKSNLLKRVKHDNAQFVTGIDFLNDTVGLANKFAMCAESSAGVNQDHNQNSLGLASTIAHEMGHNMGMSHDENHCTCGSSKKLSTLFPELFSDCSLEQLSVFLDNANPSCLLDTPSSSRLYSGSICGNAFLDPGEECDCGTVEECENPCCDPMTCRLTEGSQCVHGDCCENCQIKDAESLCRAPENECDIPEYCTGLSEHCPENDFKMNGIPCSSGDETKTLKPIINEFRFHNETASPRHDYIKCIFSLYRNMFCGKIFCDGGNDYPVTGQKAVIVTFRGFCNIAGDQSEEDALSMVPTGTKCGHNKVCYDYMCQDLNVYGSNDDCSLQCSGRGIWQLNLLFENNSAKKDRPEISQPIFMGTTITQPCTPLTARLGPTRPAPPVIKNSFLTE